MNSPKVQRLPSPPKFRLHHDAWGRLVLVDAAGQEHPGCEPLRDFPLTDPHHFISLCDAQGHELVCIPRLDDLPEEVRGVLLEDLARREFVPVIEAIEHLSSHVEPTEWIVRTDRGRTTFLVNGEDDVRRLSRSRAMIVDRHGLRYLIPDTRKLDAASRRWLERYW